MEMEREVYHPNLRTLSLLVKVPRDCALFLSPVGRAERSSLSLAIGQIWV